MQVPMKTAMTYTSINKSKYLFSRGLTDDSITGKTNRGNLILKSFKAYGKSEV